MCFSVSITREAFERDPRFHYLIDEDYDGGFHQLGFNFPKLPILTASSPDKASLARWGLIPEWVKDAHTAKSIRSKTLNARAETVGDKPSFRDSWPKLRCILPVEGFFEPHSTEDGQSCPWYITRKNREIFFLGGIYQISPESAADLAPMTFSILTVPAKELLARVHNKKLRMPLILAPESIEMWLSKEFDNIDVMAASWQIDQQELEAWPIDRGVFRRNTDDPRVREPVTTWTQKGLFDTEV